MVVTCLFFSKYTATHYQVTRSAPSREPNDITANHAVEGWGGVDYFSR